MNEIVYHNLLIRRASPEDRDTVAELIRQLPLSGADSGSSFQRQFALISHVITSSLGIMILGLDTHTKKGVGYMVAISKPKQFWLGFALRHPVYMATLFFKKLSNKTKKSGKKSEFKWSRGCKQNFRVLFIGVLPEYRKLGIALKIYQLLFEILRKNEGRLVEAHIDANNEPSVSLHRKVGYNIEKLPQGDYKASKGLNG